LGFNETRYNRMNTKSPLLCIISVGSQDICLLPKKMVLESGFGEITYMSRLTRNQRSNIHALSQDLRKTRKSQKRGAEYLLEANQRRSSLVQGFLLLRLGEYWGNR
jgi:hypothetical protein